MPLDRLLADLGHRLAARAADAGNAASSIDKRALARMKRSAYLINTARGPVVDEAALAWALQHHLLAGAALDVYEHEPAVHPDLLTLENVLLVPHLGSGTTETRTAMADLAVENVLAVLAGRPPLTPVARSRAGSRHEIAANASSRTVHAVMRALARAIDSLDLPAVEKIAEEQPGRSASRFSSRRMLSAQTRDAVDRRRVGAAASAWRARPRTMAKLTVRRSSS